MKLNIVSYTKTAEYRLRGNIVFTERLKENFNTNEPIFTEEILRVFPDFSRAQIFRYISKAKVDGEVVQFDKGVYYLPRKTVFGQSTITADMVVEKKYLRNEKDVFGVYSGIKLLNTFSVTTQMAAVIEVVTNNESAKYREIKVGNRRFVLRRARCRIDKDNAAAYTVLQLLSDFGKETKLSVVTKKLLVEYMKEKGVGLNQLFDLSLKFPPKTVKILIGSGLINDIA